MVARSKIMNAKDRNETNLSLLDAVETLSNIADLDLGRDIGIAQDHDLTVQDKKISYRTIHWLSKNNSTETIRIVKEIFRIILDYLKHFYNKEYHAVTDKKTIEGIKTVMVLVGEAAKKLDRYNNIFHTAKGQSVMDLREYKQLQEFYLTRIARKIDEGTLGKWLLALTKRSWAQKPTTKLVASKPLPIRHVFVDLESVKKDADYELFFMRKEDGTRFYSPRLIRNIKLVCDFGDYFGPNKKVEDPLEDINLWIDRAQQAAAKTILQKLGNRLDRFYREALRYKDQELVEYLNKALVALMLASNPHHLSKQIPGKSCGDYFADFQNYLREALQCLEYRKMSAYPVKKSNKLRSLLCEVIEGICLILYEDLKLFQELSHNIHGLIQEARQAHVTDHDKSKNNPNLWHGLATDFTALTKYIKKHPNGPLFKVLNFLQDGGKMAFDPLLQHDLPCQLYSIATPDYKFINVHLPAPTIQEFVNKAVVADEFKVFLRGSEKDVEARKHLLINLQDRTSWREHVRGSALEELQNVEDFNPHLTVVTLAKETEFYHQLAPYSHENHAEVFINTFKDHLNDMNAGYLIPQEIRKEILEDFVPGTLEAIHRIFFYGKNVLTREQRMDFIEIFYFLLQLKLLDVIKPVSFSLTCKDGVDIGATANAALMAFIKLISRAKLTDSDREQINLVLHSPALLVRERIVMADRFNRMLSALRTVEALRNEQGAENFPKTIKEGFGEFFEIPLLGAQVSV